MPDFDNTNRGALFKNTDDDKVEGKHPDYRGNINVDGTEYWLSAWLKTSKAGMKYMSLSIKPKNADTAKPKQSAGGGAHPHDFNDEVPF
jgi:uncharacterized protein (DUF736 family)